MQSLKVFLLSLISIFMSLSCIAQEAIDATSSGAVQVDDGVYLKRTVAIARFTNETASGTTFLVDKSGDRLGKQASDILSARLSATGRFLMFERSDAEELDTEKILAGIEDSGVAVDYLIIGSVSEFGRSTESESGVFSRSKTQKAYAKVNVRLVEVSTGRIVYSQEGAGEAFTETKKTLGLGGSAGFDQSLTDKAISAAISELVSSIVENLTKSPWKSYILAEDQGTYIIAGGASQGIGPGDIFNVYERGRLVANPQTGAKTELPGKKIGEIKIETSYGEDSFNEVSIVFVILGELDGDLSKYYITQE
jgi:curli biogenesis system outer membrane secretion channel CsgG